MTSDLMFLLKVLVAFLPFLLLILLNSAVNKKKKYRVRQFFLPPFALVYSIVLFCLLDKLSALCLQLFMKLGDLLDKIQQPELAEKLRDLALSQGVLIMFVLFNTLALLCFVILKRLLISLLCRRDPAPESIWGRICDIFYEYDRQDRAWYIKPHLGQARTFLKTAYRAGVGLMFLLLMITMSLLQKERIAAPFYPVFPLLVVGELAFFTDGLRPDEKSEDLTVSADRSKRMVLYPLLRRPLRVLFGDKLSSEGTTVNNGSFSGGSVEDVLIRMEESGGHLGKNYARFIRTKMKSGLKPDADYVRSGYELSTGKSLLFNTPFYHKLRPYAFYAMQRNLICGGKVLVVLGRHGTAEDLRQWCEQGMLEVSNVPNLWKIEELGSTVDEDAPLPDIGIISRSGVHDLEIHRNNMEFLKQVSFVFIVEPSRLVATAQIGLNLLIKCCGMSRGITYCSVDRNCDGLVDSLSHILMANITEVSATEFPHGMSSFMCWTADSDYIQHRILPGVSRYLGMGTELSFVALQNQVKSAVWYGGEVYPVLDAHWIAKQYYYDLLDYAHMPTTQETFDKYFLTSYNMCNEPMSDYAFITVEDERNNVFETKRNFSTIAQKQGFVNVISSEYMLREYMTENTGLFNADAKAVPYLTADYARTKRNGILTLCLRLCVDGVPEEELCRELLLMGLDDKQPAQTLWQEMYSLFCGDTPAETERNGSPILRLTGKDQKERSFRRDSTLCYSRKYSIRSGKFESIYTIEDQAFAAIILDDLQNAGYIAERSAEDHFIGTELKGHIYQKYLPSQFFTLGGKYYEMVAVTAGNRILVRRASEHINGRLAYRQVRNYTIHRINDADAMGSLKTVNDIDIYYQFADFSVSTPAYWKLSAYNDFRNGQLVELNGVPERHYFRKQILKLDFSKLGERFTPAVKLTLTNLLNEVFVTLFADNRPFISAVCCGSEGLPLTYSLQLEDAEQGSDNCIYIIEDSQLDLGLLIAVERNLHRILQIISDYLLWDAEMTNRSRQPPQESGEASDVPTDLDAALAQVQESAVKKRGLFARIAAWFKRVFGRKKKKQPVVPVAPVETTAPAAPTETPVAPTEVTAEPTEAPVEPAEAPTETAEAPVEPVETPAESAEAPAEPKKKKGFGAWFKGLFGKKKKEKTEEAPEEAAVEVPSEGSEEETAEEASAEASEEASHEESPAQELPEAENAENPDGEEADGEDTSEGKEEENHG